MFFPFGRAICAATIAFVIAVAPFAATADTRTSQSPNPPTLSSGTDNVRVASGELNLLSAPQSRGTPTTRKRVVVGNGSYICSPAGFGQRSRCYSN